MAKYLAENQPWSDSDFSADFGFTGSTQGPHNARNHPAPDPTDGGTYVERARGGRIHKAAGGDIQQEQLAAPHQNFGAAFAAARRQALAGGPKTFVWNGRSFNTNLASEAPHHAAPSQTQGREYAPQGNPMQGREYAPAPHDEPTYQPPAAALPPRDTGPYTEAGPYSLGTSQEDYQAGQPSQVERAHGGRIRRAGGGPIMPGTAGGQPAAPRLGAMPAGVPGGMQGAGGALSNATITMPVNDAARAAAGAVRLGHALGQHQARMQGAPPVAGPPQQAGAPAMAAKGGHLSAHERQHMPSSDFAMPGHGSGPGGKGSGSYPIPDASHARNALARVAQHGSPAEPATVRRKVHTQYPGIGKR